MKKQTVTCRYGVTYKYEAQGSKGQLFRLKTLLENCCCWVCHNHDCKEPRNEQIPDCDPEMEPHLAPCALFTQEPYCLRNKQNKDACS